VELSTDTVPVEDELKKAVEQAPFELLRLTVVNDEPWRRLRLVSVFRMNEEEWRITSEDVRVLIVSDESTT
jgi:hypothetical protein